MATPLAAFGPGIIVVQRTDIVTPAPVNVGFAQELSLDFSATNKDLFGQNQFPLVTARGTVKATGKIKAAVLSGLAWNAVFFGASVTSGGNIWNIDEAHTVGSTTQQVTNHTTFVCDLGVRYAATGLPLQQVAASSEAAGKYSVNAATGTYTFNSADEVALIFTYLSTNTGGQNLALNNQLIGATPTFRLDYYTNLNQPTSKPFSFILYACVSNKLAIASKLEDFIMPEIDFAVFADNSGKVFNMSFPEVS